MGSQGDRMVASLKTRLKADGMTYATLAEKLGMTEGGIKKAFARKSFTLERLEEICRIVGIQLSDLVLASARDGGGEQMTWEQERRLAEDDALFTVFYLLISGLSVKAVANHYDFSPSTLRKALSQLDKLGLIVLKPGDAVKPSLSINLKWIEGGPLMQKYAAQVRGEFMDAPFAEAEQFLDFCSGRLSAESAAVVRGKYQRLIQEVKDLVRLDDKRPDATPMWFVVAMRPWTFSVIRRFKKTEL